MEEEQGDDILSDPWDDLFASVSFSGPSSESRVSSHHHEETQRQTVNKPRGRGRPRGTFGSAFLRDALGMSHEQIEDVQSDPGHTISQPGDIEYAREARAKKLAEARKKQELLQKQLVSQSAPSQPSQNEARVSTCVQYGPLSIVNTTGDSLRETMLEAYIRACKDNIEPEDQLVEHQLENSFTSISTRALQEKLGESNVGMRMISIAATLIEFCAFLWGIFLCYLQTLWSRPNSTTKPIAFIARLRYDETPTKVRVADLHKKVSVDDIIGFTWEELSKSNVLPSASTSLHAKVMQTELTLGVLMFDAQTSQHTIVKGIMPTRLYAVQTTSGKNTLECLRRTLNSVPGLHTFADDPAFVFSLRHSCTDRYLANMSAERGLQEEWSKQPLLHTFCDVHKLYSATRNSMALMDADISGLLALALGWSECGAVSTFKQALCKLFVKHLGIYYSTPPTDDPDSEAHKYRQDLFELFLPIDGVTPSRAKLHRKRRYVIERFFNGHLYNNDEIQHFCCYNCCLDADYTFKMLAIYCAWALVPSQAPVFPRSRRTRWDASIDWCGLIEGCHGLLGKLIAEITGVPVASPASEEEIRVSHAVPPIAIDDDWDLMFSESTVALKPVQQAPLEQPLQGNDANTDPIGDGVEEDWTKKKKQNEKKAGLWLQSKPFPRLAIMKSIAVVLMGLMYRFLALSGPSYERRQRINASKKKKRSFAALEAAKGQDLQDSMKKLLLLLGTAPKAVLRDMYTAKLKSLRFRVISSAMCPLHALLRHPRQGCPFKVFAALEPGGSARLMSTPPCMRDVLADMILKQYVTQPKIGDNIF